MTVLSLRPGLSHCIVRGRTIFLDLAANRYFALQSDLDAAFQLVTSGRTPAVAANLIARLMKLNIVVAGTAGMGFSHRSDLPAPTESMLDAREGKRSIGSIIRLLAGETYALVALRRGNLFPLIERCRQKKAASPERGLGKEAGEDILANMRVVDLILSPHHRCLARSIAIFHEMGRTGYWPSLVIGVAETNFGAHCWLQCGNIVLNDLVDTVRAYRPIVVV